ncbi:UDP-glucose 4-epimerase GalE [Gammaproteobacteria bacterium]|nr:UDP-glucose 4-epimerase GalE [Gammaproteobacteria bacterium]
MNFLIPGGAGYIGSHMVKYLLDRGHDVVILDDFSTGHKWATQGCEVIELNILDNDSLKKSLKKRNFDSVIHFAAKSIVSDSVSNPIEYYRNNFIGTLNLVDAMISNDINNLVFSSTAAIFGNPQSSKIDENHQKLPLNPYGKSKLMVESFLKDICSRNLLNATCFRYFNAAGAHKSALIGEMHENETHLIPNILNSVLSNKNELKVFGKEFKTPDGTCIRDYVHVDDLAQAHFLGIQEQKNLNDGSFKCYNLGNEEGFSVLEVINACEKVTGKEIKFSFANSRDGDPAELVSDSSMSKSCLNWSPQYSSIESIIRSAWKWHKSLN